MIDLKTVEQSKYFVGSLPSFSVIQKLPAPKEGEICYAQDTDNLYLYKNNQWIEFSNVQINGEGLELSLYELNRTIISQLNPLSKEDIIEKKQDINNFVSNNKFYMMYGREVSYFTVFHISDDKAEFSNLADGVLECLSVIGDIYSIEMVDNTAIEIWVKFQDIVTCLYLFPYDNGVVRIGG